MIRPLIALILLTFAFPAFAQDKVPEDWSGPYISVSAGGDSKQITVSGSDSVTQISNLFVPGRGIVVVPGTVISVAGSKRETGFSGGGTLGWLGQSRNFVYGIEVGGTYNVSSSTASMTATLPQTILTPAATVTSTRSVKSDFDAFARLKLGYAMGRTLIYATGGVAGTRVRMSATDSFSEPGGPAAPCAPTPCTVANFAAYGPAVTSTGFASKTMIGWIAGAGIEQKLGKNFSIGLDFSHKDYGAKTLTPNSSATAYFTGAPVDSNGNVGLKANAIPGLTRVKMRDDRLAVTLAFHF